jgi:hypothetical protein
LILSTPTTESKGWIFTKRMSPQLIWGLEFIPIDIADRPLFLAVL